MPALFIFLLKVNIALLLFCAGYFLVLRRLTFYTLNRVYLVTAILFASIYPEINLSKFAQRHLQIAKPVQAIVFNWRAPAASFVSPLERPNYWHWAEIVFWVVAFGLAVRLIGQLYSLYRLYCSSTAARILNHDVRVMSGDSGPFSFWKSIYVNPSRHEQADLKAILLHEQVHVNEWHTLDILLAELSTIFYWFNPGVWLMKKAIRENIEFITDQKILNKGADSVQYQYSLVSVSFASSSNTIVNHFNISTIKKRIIMMNAKRSSKFTLTRYAFLVPAVVALLLVFSISKAALIRGRNAYKTMAETIEAHVKTARTTKPAIAAGSKAAVTGVIIRTSLFKHADTTRKGDNLISYATSSDSLTYVINGKKATKAAFKALDPDQIFAIEIVSGEQAAKIMDDINSDREVLFVTTDDSEAGKKFKEKIDKLNGSGYINDAGAVSVYGYNQNGSSGNGLSVGTGHGRLSLTLDSNFSTMRYSRQELKLHRFKAFPKGTYTITDDSLSKIETPSLTLRSDDSAMVYELNGAKSKTGVYTYKIRPYTGRALTSVSAAPARTFTYAPKAITVTGWGSTHVTSIDHLSNKVIIIDGKEATESDMKKLSAADIESLSSRSGDDMTKQYGAKAKNGVLFIVTKKK